MKRTWALTAILLLGWSGPSWSEEPKELTVTFEGAGEIKLSGTWMMPTGLAEGARVPAVVIVAGSGPVDRNGNSGKALQTDLYKLLAQEFARLGIASLRYDKRGMHANILTIPKDKAEWPKFFAWENFVGDVLGAVKWMREQPAVDAKRVGIVGHSEGGLVALAAAKRLRDIRDEPQEPAALVLIAAPGRPLYEIITEQIDASLKRGKLTDEEAEKYRAANARAIKSVRETGKCPEDLPKGLEGLYPGYLGPFLQAMFKSDPVALAENFQGKALVVNGSRDMQISPDRDGKALEAAPEEAGQRAARIADPGWAEPLSCAGEGRRIWTQWDARFVGIEEDRGLAGEGVGKIVECKCRVACPRLCVDMRAPIAASKVRSSVL